MAAGVCFGYSFVRSHGQTEVCGHVGPMGPNGLDSLAKQALDSVQDAPFTPTSPPALAHAFAAVCRGGMLAH